jgi:hypothetical protein
VLTKDECKKIISKVAWQCGCSPRLIATRLLSEDDKHDMLNGDLPLETLICTVKTWMDAGMPDYAHGDSEPMKKNF